MDLFLGADGGGTKTAFALVRADGQVLAQVQAPSSYYFTEGLPLVERVLVQGVSATCEAAGVQPGDITRAFFALPSYGEVSGDVAALDAAPARALGHDRYDCDNDMVAGWAGSLAGADGINVVAGTGSMTYGQRGATGVRVGGWGELFGDEGSAYWLAQRGLALASRQADGRAPAPARGSMLEVLREHLQLGSDLDLVDVVLNRWRSDRGEVAGLAPVVVRAGAAGDGAAAALVAEAARELVLLVTTTAARLAAEGEGARGWGSGDELVPVSYSGGVFRAAPLLDAFRQGLVDAPGQYDLRHPQHSPVVGAALYAARRHGSPLADEALARLRTAAPPPATEAVDAA